MKKGWVVGAVLFALLGAAMIVAGVVVGGPALLGLVIAGATMLAVGVIWLMVARYMGNLEGKDVLERGIPGTATVTSVRDTGVTINSLNAVFELGLLVQVPGRAPYEATSRTTVGRAQLGQIVPGVMLGVMVDPDDPQRVVVQRGDQAAPATLGYAPSTPTTPGAPTAGTLLSPAGAVAVPALSGTTQVTGTVSSADIVAQGSRGTAVVQHVAPTGMVAGQVAAIADPSQADDPIMLVTMVAQSPELGTWTAQGAYRIPDGKALAPGMTVPIAYLPQSAATHTTIVWDEVA